MKTDIMKWYNPPTKFLEEEKKDKNRTISVSVPGKVDYWRVTLHGFIKDDAPFYYQEVEGDFEASVKFSADYRTLYDQAGLMVRLDERVWMKCGIEYYMEKQHASTVITRDFSDWSILPVEGNPGCVWVKVKRRKECIETFYSVDGEEYIQIRQGYLSPESKLQVGIMAAAPTGDGFDVVFEDFKIIQ
mmetsp:Transcript_13029/g.18736  ORF Transcript_13029/g.18736 Transcript_13029/m.18736 type:complete len:188 (+) Transcript_13029:139-702(+)